jgi:hypothetical protein
MLPPAATPWRRSEDVLERRADGVLLLAVPGRRDPLVLRGSAVAVWEMLERPATETRISHELAQRYHTDVEFVRPTVTTACANLERAGALRRAAT